jgi:hypothetical protein
MLISLYNLFQISIYYFQKYLEFKDGSKGKVGDL